MKKIFGLVCLLCSFCFFLPAQEIVEIYEEQTTEVNPVTHETRTTTKTLIATTPFTIREFAHWSVTLDAGFNVFQGDMESDFKVLYKEPFKHWSLGGTVEFTVNPMYSLGIGYMYNHVRARDERSNAGVERGHMESNFHHIFPFIGINLLNFPIFERNKKWDFWLTVGVGALHYNSDLYYEYRPELASNAAYTEEEWYTLGNPGHSQRSEWTATVPLGFELAYNITDQFVIGLKYRLHFHTTDILEGGDKLGDNDAYGRKNYSYVGSANDALSNFLLTLRWDIATKGKIHMRNVGWGPYVAQPVKDPRVDELAKKLEELEDKVENIEMTPVIIPMEGADCECDDIPLAVYFAFDKTNLDKEALQTIMQVAKILYDNPEYRLEVRGYTDIVGSNAYNDKLSQRRADVIKNELITVFGIDPNRITANGEGKATEPAPNDRKYHPINRRCDFFFIK